MKHKPEMGLPLKAENLRKLRSCSGQVYRGMPNQGHHDEKEVTSLLAGCYWTLFVKNRTSTIDFAKRVMYILRFICTNSFALILPALLVSSLEISRSSGELGAKEKYLEEYPDELVYTIAIRFAEEDGLAKAIEEEYRLDQFCELQLIFDKFLGTVDPEEVSDLRRFLRRTLLAIARRDR